MAQKALEEQLDQARRLPRNGRGWREVRARARARYLASAAELDKMLEEFSFIIPSRQLEKGRLPAHIAAARFEAACPP